MLIVEENRKLRAGEAELEELRRQYLSWQAERADAIYPLEALGKYLLAISPTVLQPQDQGGAT